MCVLVYSTRHSLSLLKSLKSLCSSFGTLLRRVQGVAFTEVSDDETTLTFLLDLGHKGPLYKYPSMYVDHMHQRWRTLAAIINKCLSGKAASNDRLRKSRIDILWGMQLKKDRHENIPYLRFTKNHYQSLHLETPIPHQATVYRLPIPETMLTEGIKQSESYQMFIKYSTGLIPSKKSRDDNIIPEPDVTLELGKSISLTKAAEEEAARQVHATHARIVIEFVPKDARRRPSGIAFRDTSSVTKKMSPNLSNKLSGVQTLTPEEQLAADMMEALKASRKSIRSQSHVGGSSEGIGTKPRVPDESTVTPTTSSEGTEQESEYSKEGDDDENIEWVDTDEEEKKKDDDDDKSIDLEKTNDEETDDEFVHSEENVQDDDEETDDELVHVDEQVNKDEDEEMTKAKDVDTGNGDEEITDTANVDAEKTEVVKDDIKKVELPPTSSILSVSSGFEMLQIQPQSILIVPVFVISEPSILTPIHKTPSVVPETTLLPPQTVSSISHLQLQTITPIPSSPITTEAPPVTTIPHPLPIILQRVSVLEKDVQELKEVNNTTILHASLRSKIPSSINVYLGSSLGDALQKSVQANIINEVKNPLPKFLPKSISDFATLVIQSTIKKALEKTSLLLAQSSSQAQSSLKAAESLSEYELKTILFEKMNKSHSYLTHNKHQVLYDVLLNSLILNDDIARGQADLE
ncbi:hypothetical protein Tco_0976954 [Tanacetum coccineum]|uniref:Uncharacterized protein n=1 Tax=Tanacetum coccineum TaxID=301880 RepID=A0ABQ5EJ73_9ASTR